MQIQNLEITGGLQMASSYDPGGSVVTGNLQVELTPSTYIGNGAVWANTTPNIFQSGNVDATFYNANIAVVDAQDVFQYNSTTGFTLDNLNNAYRISLPSVDTKTSFNSQDQYSVEVWVNIDSIQSEVATVILAKRSGTEAFARWPYEIIYQPTENIIFITCRNGNDNPIVGIYNVPEHKWVQIVGVFNFTNTPTDQTPAIHMSGYLNGQYVDSTDLSSVYTTNIGNNHPVGLFGWLNQPKTIIPDYFSGQIGIFRVYNKALSGVEVFQNFQANRTRFGV